MTSFSDQGIEGPTDCQDGNFDERHTGEADRFDEGKREKVPIIKVPSQRN